MPIFTQTPEFEESNMGNSGNTTIDIPETQTVDPLQGFGSPEPKEPKEPLKNKVTPLEAASIWEEEGENITEVLKETATKAVSQVGSKIGKGKGLVIGIGVIAVVLVIATVVYLKGWISPNFGGNVDLSLLEQSEEPANSSLVIESPDSTSASVTQDVTEVISQDSYTEEEKSLLRAVGFTGSDIEGFQKAGIDPHVKYKEERSRILAAQQEILSALKDVESPEYRRLLRDTYLGERPVSDIELGVKDYISLRFDSFNTTFKKVQPRGSVLYFRIKLPEDMGDMFFPVTLEKYMEYPDSGNILVSLGIIDVKTNKFVTDLTIIE